MSSVQSVQRREINEAVAVGSGTASVPVLERSMIGHVQRSVKLKPGSVGAKRSGGIVDE